MENLNYIHFFFPHFNLRPRAFNFPSQTENQLLYKIYSNETRNSKENPRHFNR